MYSYKRLFLRKGNLTIMFPDKSEVEQLPNYNLIDQNIINKTYLYYNYNNKYSGTKRIFMGNVNNKYDMISIKGIDNHDGISCYIISIIQCINLI